MEVAEKALEKDSRRKAKEEAAKEKSEPIKRRKLVGKQGLAEAAEAATNSASSDSTGGAKPAGEVKEPTVPVSKAKASAKKPEAAPSEAPAEPKAKAKSEAGKGKRSAETLPEESAAEKAKAKRRAKALEAYELLKQVQAEEVPGLTVPGDLGDRVSYTLQAPADRGVSIGVVLSSESFFVSKPTDPQQWPSMCDHLKAWPWCNTIGCATGGGGQERSRSSLGAQHPKSLGSGKGGSRMGRGAAARAGGAPLV